MTLALIAPSFINLSIDRVYSNQEEIKAALDLLDGSKKVKDAMVTGDKNGELKTTLGNDLKEGPIAWLAPFFCYKAEVRVLLQ